MVMPKGQSVIVKRPYHWREKQELRAKIQEHTHKYTALIRADIQRRWREGWRIGDLGWFLPGPSEIVKGEEISPERLDVLQPAIEEYDPVVELALIAVDYRNEPNLRRMANSDAAPYLRPKMAAPKGDLGEDPDEGEASMENKTALLNRLVGAIDLIASSKVRGEAIIDVTPEATDTEQQDDPSPGHPGANGHDPEQPDAS